MASPCVRATGKKGLLIARVFLRAGPFCLSQRGRRAGAWLPWHAAWVYFGSAFIAAGAVLTGVYARLASVIMSKAANEDRLKTDQRE